MRYNKIRSMDIANGPGVRVSIFLQGCSFHCKGCFNPETHDFSLGKEYTKEVEDKIVELLSLDYISGLSILGGEPLHPNNILGTLALAKRIKEMYPKKSIWVWTGYLYSTVVNKDIFKYIDVLVDGPFMEELAAPTLKFKGSSNQRVIDIQKSNENTIVFYEA